jgi:cell division protein FtsW
MNETLRKYFRGDAVVWAVIVSLSIVSVLAVYSSTGTLAYKYKHGDTSYYAIMHFTYLFIGLVIIFVTHLIPYKYYSRLSQLFLLLSIPLLGLTLVFGQNINEASRWLTLPVVGFSFQTSDFAKLAVIMFVARQLSLKQDSIKDFTKTFLPMIAWVTIVCVLILPANFSTAAILFVSALILMFVGRVSFKHILAVIGLGIIIITLLVLLSFYVFHYEGRIKTWKARIENYVSGKHEENFQVEQSKIAIATGGIIGKGPGKSVQRNFLPHPYSDFIYSIVIEEYGLIGGVIVLFFYLWLLFRAGIIVRKSDRTFPAFLAFGLTMILVFQAMVNMAVAVNLFPVTGQPLPFVSKGGSSVLFSCFALGIILSVSRGGKEQELKPVGIEENLKKEVELSIDTNANK